jgi:hypothetical protein
MPDLDPKTDIADAGSAHQLIHGWRDCENETDYREWLRTHLAAARDGGAELRAAMADAERAGMDDYLEPELREAEASGDSDRMAELVAARAEFVRARREEAEARLHRELVRYAVRTATTPRDD